MTMQVNARNTGRWRFDCICCQTKPGKARKAERRALKRRERQAWRREL